MKEMDRLIELRIVEECIDGYCITMILHLLVAPLIRVVWRVGTASARIDKTPLSLRIDFTLLVGRSNIDPILMSRIRLGGVGVSGADGFDYVNAILKSSTLADPELSNDRDEGLRVIDLQRYRAANHFSTSVNGGRNVTSAEFADTLMTRTIRPSSPCTLSTLQPRKSATIFCDPSDP
jgi:hypothetical protein